MYWKSFGFIDIVDAVVVVVVDVENAKQSGKRANGTRSETKLDLWNNKNKKWNKSKRKGFKTAKRAAREIIIMADMRSRQ